MRLRNKKTGDILPLQMTIDGKKYQSLAEFIEDYEDLEDYTPAKLLIKDEKIRKAVRAWAEANGTSKLTFDGYYILTDEQANDIEFGYFKPLELLEKGKEYTIEELCGEEEE